MTSPEITDAVRLLTDEVAAREANPADHDADLTDAIKTVLAALAQSAAPVQQAAPSGEEG